MIKLSNVDKVYVNGDIETHALKNVDLTIEEGEFIVVLGPSGSGKSTLLNVLSGLDVPTKGTININDSTISAMSQKEMTQFRRAHLGFIFQQYNLLSTLTVKENVLLGAYISKSPFEIETLMEKIGLTDQQDKYPHQLSGGQQQRVSIARAIIKKPLILFCDEPTGALDEDTGKSILSLLNTLNESYKTTLILITHNPGIASMADRIIKMNSGAIVEIIKNKDKVKAQDIRWS